MQATHAKEPSGEQETADTETVVEAPPPYAAGYEGALLDTQNGQGFAETPGYRKLLELVHLWPATDFDARPRERLDYEAALSDPDAWRGRLVTVRALLIDLRAERLSRPLWDFVDAYRAVVVETDGTEGVYCDMLGAPADLDLRQVELERDIVDVEGVFYRTLSYENRKGQITTVPYIIAKRIGLANLDDASRKTLNSQLLIGFIGLALAFVAVRVMFVVHRHRSRRGGRASSTSTPRVRATK